jgi:hypothetical protein
VLDDDPCEGCGTPIVWQSGAWWDDSGLHDRAVCDAIRDTAGVPIVLIDSAFVADLRRDLRGLGVVVPQLLGGAS